MAKLLDHSPDLTAHPNIMRADRQRDTKRKALFIIEQCGLLLGAWFTGSLPVLLSQLAPTVSENFLRLIFSEATAALGYFPFRLAINILQNFATIIVIKFITQLLVPFVPVAALSKWSYEDMFWAKSISVPFEVFAGIVVEIWYRRSTGLTLSTALPGVTALNALLAYGGQGEDMMLALLDAGFDLGEINKPGGHASEIFWWAGHRGYLRVTERLLHQGIDVDIRWTPRYRVGSYGPTALYYAARGGHQELVKLLIGHFANVNAFETPGQPPLLAAAQQLREGCQCAPHLSIISILLGAQARVNTADADGRSVLSFATVPCASQVLNLLLEAGADPNMADVNGKTPLHRAAWYYHNSVNILSLVRGGAAVNALDNNGKSALTIAVGENGDPEVAALLLKNGADVRTGGGHYGSPIAAAARYSSVGMIELLIDAGADVNHQSYATEYHTPLFAAIGQPQHANRLEVVKVLLKRGADVSLKDGRGRQALYMTTSNGGNIDDDTLNALISSSAAKRYAIIDTETRGVGSTELNQKI